jgi:hypothetical protein
MSYTTTDLTRLQRALADGVKSVTLSDGSTTIYRDLAELKDAIRIVEAAVTVSTGTAPRRRATVIHTSKGVY